MEASASFYLFLNKKMALGPMQILSFGFKMRPRIGTSLPLILMLCIALSPSGTIFTDPSS